MHVKLTIEVDGNTDLVIENNDQGWFIESIHLRGDVKEVFDPVGYVATGELVRIWGYLESHTAIIRALNQRKESEND